MTVAAWALLGYVAGSFPSAWLVALATGKRRVLTHVRRTVGEADAHLLLAQSGGGGGGIAAALDVVKAFGPVMAAHRAAGPYAIAACSVGTVAGHCWPPLMARYAGRGVAAAAGAFFGFLPLEMAIAGVVRVLGSLVGAGGLSSTVGYMAIPFVAVLRRQPTPFVVAAAAVNLLIFVRRLEGLHEDIDLGLSRGRAVLRRTLLDASGAGR